MLRTTNSDTTQHAVLPCDHLQYSSGVAKGAVGQLPPVGLDSDKIIVGSVVHTAELTENEIFSFYEKRSVAKNVQKMRLRPSHWDPTTLLQTR